MKNAYNASAYGSFAYVYDIFQDKNIYYFDGTCDFCDSANIIYCFCSDAWSGNEKRAVYKDTCYHAGTCLNF